MLQTGGNSCVNTCGKTLFMGFICHLHNTFNSLFHRNYNSIYAIHGRCNYVLAVPLSSVHSCRAAATLAGFLLTHLCPGCPWWAEGRRRTSGWRRSDTTDQPWLTQRTHSRTDTRRWGQQTSRETIEGKKGKTKTKKVLQLLPHYKSCIFITSETFLGPPQE